MHLRCGVSHAGHVPTNERSRAFITAWGCVSLNKKNTNVSPFINSSSLLLIRLLGSSVQKAGQLHHQYPMLDSCLRNSGYRAQYRCGTKNTMSTERRFCRCLWWSSRYLRQQLFHEGCSLSFHYWLYIDVTWAVGGSLQTKTPSSTE